MSEADSGESKRLSVEEMRAWLLEETRNVLKECELRVREATEFTTAYAMGELTAEEAHKRLRKYDSRWSEPLAGVRASSYKSDDAILAAIDKAHRSDRVTRKKYERILDRGGKGWSGLER